MDFVPFAIELYGAMHEESALFLKRTASQLEELHPHTFEYARTSAHLKAVTVTALMRGTAQGFRMHAEKCKHKRRGPRPNPGRWSKPAKATKGDVYTAKSFPSLAAARTRALTRSISPSPASVSLPCAQPLSASSFEKAALHLSEELMREGRNRKLIAVKADGDCLISSCLNATKGWSNVPAFQSVQELRDFVADHVENPALHRTRKAGIFGELPAAEIPALITSWRKPKVHAGPFFIKAFGDAIGADGVQYRTTVCVDKPPTPITVDHYLFERCIVHPNPVFNYVSADAQFDLLKSRKFEVAFSNCERTEEQFQALGGQGKADRFVGHYDLVTGI